MTPIEEAEKALKHYRIGIITYRELYQALQEAALKMEVEDGIEALEFYAAPLDEN